jgi:hypothetical protein
MRERLRLWREAAALVRRSLERRAPDPEPLLRHEADWYRCKYMLAVGYANLAQAAGDERMRLPKRLGSPEELAKQHAFDLATTMEKDLCHLDEIAGRRKRDRDRVRTSKEFLMALQPSVLLLLAGVVRRWGPASAFPPFHDDRDIVAQVETRQLDYRARYNLACYYAGRADDEAGDRRTADFERAFSELRAALETAPRDLVVWARDDPSLAGLRDDETFQPRFEKLCAELLG